MVDEAEPRLLLYNDVPPPPPSICNIDNYDDGAEGEGVVNDDDGGGGDVTGDMLPHVPLILYYTCLLCAPPIFHLAGDVTCTSYARSLAGLFGFHLESR